MNNDSLPIGNDFHPLQKPTEPPFCIPSLRDTLDFIEIYERLRRDANIKASSNLKRNLKYFIKATFQSNRFGEGHLVYLKTICREFARLNEGAFPQPSTLHTDGIYNLVAHTKIERGVAEIEGWDIIEDLDLDDIDLEGHNG